MYRDRWQCATLIGGDMQLFVRRRAVLNESFAWNILYSLSKISKIFMVAFFFVD